MALDALRASPLVEQAAQRMRDEISGGQWEVGMKLPSETALVKILGVGRSTVREALRSLSGAGLVQARQGAGVFVIATTPHEDWATGMRRSAITDVYEVRMLVEVEAVRLAAVRRTADDIAGIRAALRHRAQAAGEGDAQFVDADIALHATVVAAAHNPVLTGLFTEFLPVLRQGLIDLVQLFDLRADRPDHGADAHAVLVDAVCAGDAEAAGGALRAELEQTLARLQRR
ncbi:FCD domain-containing protein [Winogradskya consettensis]|uniref:GntR family transcriptional regulator n=1 Tax=Winogradskya consettensis TaxID=113560 RepID=A0A919SCX1_9ACTN|nr:FCD domain-containing protein [Actinoplanes consettensis]GIM68283.1 GntR family transcriptional regulator [Actinoplanes consettensis]